MKGAIGKSHLAAARDTLAEVSVEKSEQRKREKVNQAQVLLRAAYRLFADEATAGKARPLSTRQAAILAHRNAVEVAVYIATLDRHLGSHPVNVEKWIATASTHFDSYAELSKAAAGNGLVLVGAPTAVLAAGSYAIAAGGLIATMATGGIGLPITLAALAGAARTIGHIRVPARVAREGRALKDLDTALRA
jgi:hypothetical protein